MGYRSTALMVILVFGILFSLLYSSFILANQDTERRYQILASKRADIEIYRLRMPQNICFGLDSQNLSIMDKNIAKELSDSGADTFSATIKLADSNAESDRQMEHQLQPPKKYFEMMQNRYSGEGLHLEKAEAITPFLRTYEDKLDYTVEHLEKRKGIFRRRLSL